MARSTVRVSVVAALSVLALAACAPPSSNSGGSGGGAKAATATSARTSAAWTRSSRPAKKEGQLNVIALPPDWANYGNIIKAFSDKYGIKVNSAQPDAASQDEINAAKSLKGTKRAPDVFDLGQSVALANTSMFAPYKVSTWDDIPADFKDPKGTWVNDYGGYMSIGYDSSKVPDVDQSQRPARLRLQGQGRPQRRPDPGRRGLQRRDDGLAGQRGLGRRHQPGVDYFGKLKDAGNFLPVDPTPATIESGQTPVVIDWDYLNAAETKKLKTWKVMVPDNAVIAGYYYQAVNTDAPHPAAARLWQEFLYSDAGQNLWLGRRCPPGAGRRDGQGRHDRQGGVRRAAPSQRRPR